MMNPSKSRSSRFWSMALSILAVGASMSLLAGCEKKKPPPVVEPPPPPPPPPPAQVQVDPILASMSPSAKVQFPQTAAPHNEALARAVIAFADALAKGDAEKFEASLGPADKQWMSRLTNDGSWETETAKLEAVRVVMVEDGVNADPTGAAVYFALQTPEGADVIGWGAAKVGDQWMFIGAPSTKATKRRASEWDSVGILALMNDSAAEIVVPDVPIPDGMIPPGTLPDGQTPPETPSETPPAETPPTGG